MFFFLGISKIANSLLVKESHGVTCSFETGYTNETTYRTGRTRNATAATTKSRPCKRFFHVMLLEKKKRFSDIFSSLDG